jgi:hypothetical protein
MPKIVQPEPYIIYSLEELKKLFPDAYDKAYERWKSAEYEYAGEDSMHDMISSFKEIVSALGLTMKNWQFSPYDYSHSVSIGSASEYYDREELLGVRGYKYIINRLDPHFTNSWNRRINDRKASWLKPWRRRECPFTGMCYDESIIEEIKASVLKGSTIEQALKWAWDNLQTACEADIEYQQTEENFLERECDTMYTENGNIDQ